MKRIVGTILFALLGVVAAANVASVSGLWFYQPKLPKSLQK